MDESSNFQFPILIIQAIRPLLQKGDKVFANEIKAEMVDGTIISFYENKGIDLGDYIGQRMECLLEITRGSFKYTDATGNRPENAIVFQYHWLRRPYEFFPELADVRNDLRDSRTNDEEKLMNAFEDMAGKYFSEWGLSGLNIGIYQAKPLLISEMGLFLLNEYEFEEEIEYLELYDEVFIDIQEMYLRGIKPLDALKPVLPYVGARQNELKEQPSEKKKSWFEF